MGNAMPKKIVNFITPPSPISYSCECRVPAAYKDLYDLDDEDSLNAFHNWIGITVSDALLAKYGPVALDVVVTSELFELDLGLLIDCDFQEQPDGSLKLIFERQHYPKPLREGWVFTIIKQSHIGSEMNWVYLPPREVSLEECSSPTLTSEEDFPA
jgi:hypothetical protein